jgi:hypothetical protein
MYTEMVLNLLQTWGQIYTFHRLADHKAIHKDKLFKLNGNVLKILLN